MADANVTDTHQEVNVLQSYSDAIAGRSLQLFYGVSTNQSTGASRILIRDSGRSRPLFIEWNEAAGDGTAHNFDLTINKPTIIAGLATIDCKVYRHDHGAGNFYVKFYLIHYNGVAETTIGTVFTEIVDVDLTVTTKLKMSVTRKVFGVGEILRLKAVANFDSTNAGHGYLAHDPMTAGDELKIWVPVVNLE